MLELLLSTPHILELVPKRVVFLLQHLKVASEVFNAFLQLNNHFLFLERALELALSASTASSAATGLPCALHCSLDRSLYLFF